MKRWKWLTLGMLLAAVCMLTMGCGKVTVASLFQEANKNAKDAKSVDMDVLFDLECKMEAENAATGMEFHFDLNAQAENEKGLCVDGNAEISLLGTEMTVPMKSYTVLGKEKNTVYTYDPNTDSWTYAKKDTEEDFAKDIVVYDYSKISDKLTLAEGMEEYHDKKCYSVSGQIKGSELSDLFKNMEEELQQYQLDEDALEYLTADLTFYFDGKTKDIAGIYFDFSNSDWDKLSEDSKTADEIGMSGLFGGDAKLNVPEFSLEIIVNSYDDYKFELPADVKEQAVEDESKSENVMMNLGGDTDTDVDTEPDTNNQSNGDAVLDKSLDIAKGNFKIDGKSYQLKEGIDALEGEGWVFDTEYNDSDMIPAEDYEVLFFTKNDKSISLYIVNEASEEKSYKECSMYGVYDSDTESSSLELDGGIKIGSSYDDVVAAFGEPEDIYEDGDYKSLDYVSASGDVSLEISFNENIVSSIMLTGDF